MPELPGARRLAALLLPALLAAPALASTAGDRVVFLVGEGEYGSERTVPAFARELAAETGLAAVVRQGAGRAMPEPPELGEAELLVLYLRFREPTGAQLAKLERWLDAGRPVLALRTTSHAFAAEELRGWFPPRFGGHYRAHAPNEEGTVAVAAPPAAGHPVLRGVPRVLELAGGTYDAQPLADGAEVLLFGRTGGRPAQPVAWTFSLQPGQRLLYTSLGTEADFADRGFRNLLANAVLWCLGREVPPV